jgi:hypothetical protein
LLEVFDDVELDVSLAQDLQRAARLASARVVVQQRGRHGVPPSCSPRSIASVVCVGRSDANDATSTRRDADGPRG